MRLSLSPRSRSPPPPHHRATEHCPTIGPVQQRADVGRAQILGLVLALVTLLRRHSRSVLAFKPMVLSMSRSVASFMKHLTLLRPTGRSAPGTAITIGRR